MSAEIPGRDLQTRRIGAGLISLSLLFCGHAACAQVDTPPAELTTSTVPLISSPTFKMMVNRFPTHQL